jgi:hypothetical protein
VSENRTDTRRAGRGAGIDANDAPGGDRGLDRVQVGWMLYGLGPRWPAGANGWGTSFLYPVSRVRPGALECRSRRPSRASSPRSRKT